MASRSDAGPASWIPENLVINADDFGLHPRISLGIARCLDEGLIDSFSVAAFADPFHDGLLRDLVARHPWAKVGVHLHVLPDAADEHPGHFRDFLAQYALGRYPAARVEREWEAQIALVGGYLGGPERVSHLDGHQHLHVLPGLWPAACRLREKYRIPRLRVPFEASLKAALVKFPFGTALQALARLRWNEDQPRFIGFSTSARFTVAENLALLREIPRHPDRKYEIMVHPALAPGEGGAAGASLPAAVRAPEAARTAEIGELRKLRAIFRPAG
jgi:predicted glycoside hydrolase/deacetylase ChbG (UPF0249 family)